MAEETSFFNTTALPKTMRVIFVGIHNKPGMEPLDSRTLSGKTIDMVIGHLEGVQCIKTNLFDLDYLPSRKEGNSVLWKFTERTRPQNDDIMVLLGRDVQKFLEGVYTCKVIKALHPSLRFSKTPRDTYARVMAQDIQILVQMKSL